MKTFLVLSLLFGLNSYAQVKFEDEPVKQEKENESDKQLMKRDICRKPIEALETKYDKMQKKDLEKLKSECTY